jgi:hypothetical protein
MSSTCGITLRSNYNLQGILSNPSITLISSLPVLLYARVLNDTVFADTSLPDITPVNLISPSFSVFVFIYDACVLPINCPFL